MIEWLLILGPAYFCCYLTRRWAIKDGKHVKGSPNYNAFDCYMWWIMTIGLVVVGIGVAIHYGFYEPRGESFLLK